MRKFLLGAAAWLAAAPAVAQDSGSPPLAGLIQARRWVEAEGQAARVPDPVVAKLLAFERALTPGAATLAQIEAFRAGNPAWPQQATLTARREAALAATPDDAAAAAACAGEMPQGAPALLRCAEAARRLGQPGATVSARAAWVAAPADARWEAAFLQDWSTVLTADDEWARFDRLAWGDAAAAARQAVRLPPPLRAVAMARLALRRDDPQAARLLATAGSSPEDPGLFLEHARWLRRGGHEAQALALWQQGGAAAEREAAEPHRAAFWDERSLLARHLLRSGDAAGAYSLASGTAQTAPEQVADATFLAGWIALRRLSDPARAAADFEALALLSPSVLTQARAHYWLSRAAAAQGDAASARREALAAASYPTTYYGQLAALATGDDPASLQTRILRAGIGAGGAAPEQDAPRFVSGELVRAALWLTAWGQPGHAAAFLLRQAEDADPANLALTARLAVLIGLPQTGVAVARRAGRAGSALVAEGWPLDPAVSADGPVERALVLAVIRQESSFDAGAISPAGARGLMQLMPSLAAAQSRALGLPASVAALTEDPGYNQQLGSHYLHDLLASLGGNLPLAAAAYNAGPGRIREWIAQNGDPRGQDAAGVVDWIELIPFAETRNYVQRVIESVAIYRARLGVVLPYPVPWQPLPA